MTAAARGALLAAGAFAAAYALPLYAPPATAPVAADPGLLQRLFPGVPPAWVAFRLVAVALAVACFLRATRAWPQPAPAEPAAEAPPRRGWTYAALATALALLGLAATADHLGRGTQVAFVALLSVPTLLVRHAQHRLHMPRVRREALATAALTASWVLGRGWLVRGDSRAATPVDTWANFDAFREAAGSTSNLLTQRFEPGASDLAHLLVGAPLVQALGWEPSFAWMQGAALFWIAASAGLVHALAVRFGGPAAGPLAAACFLFAPATLWLPLTPAPIGLATALGTGLLLAFHGWAVRRSPAALVALGTLGGSALAFGHTVVPAALLGIATALTLPLRRPPWPVLATAVVALLAAALPVMPGADDVMRMRQSYLERYLPWATVEDVLLGQADPEKLRDVDGEVRHGDIAAGALLAPVATARTSLRLWGDVFLEPLTIVLGLGGIVLALRQRLPAPACLLGFLAVAWLPGLTSSYDRPSLIRMALLPVVFAVLAGCAGAALARLGGGRTCVRIAALAAAIAASGLWLFDGVFPQRLAKSWITIAVEACGDEERCLLIDFAQAERRGGLRVASIGAAFGSRVTSTASVADVSSLRAAVRAADADWIAWSPALEARTALAADVCGSFPRARLFAATDAARLSHARLAYVGDGAPTVDGARQRLREIPCAVHLDPGSTDSLR